MVDEVKMIFEWMIDNAGFWFEGGALLEKNHFYFGGTEEKSSSGGKRFFGLIFNPYHFHLLFSTILILNSGVFGSGAGGGYTSGSQSEPDDSREHTIS